MGLSSGAIAAITAGLSAATSLTGTLISSNAAKASAEATAKSNWETQQAQAQGFYSRNAATSAQTAAEQAAQDQTLASRSTALEQTRAAQSAAIQRQQDILDAENQQAESLRSQGDTAAQTLLQQTSAPNLQAASDTSQQEAAALLSGVMPSSPAGTDPATGTVSTRDDSSTSALARRAAEAATNIRDYGSKIGKVQSYQAPLYGVSQAISENKAGIMPASVASQLLQSGSDILLLPAKEQYSGATGYGSALDTALQERGQNALDLAKLQYTDDTALATLKQSNATTLAANEAAQAKANASAAQSTGSIISGLGNLGLMTAGYIGGGGKLSNLFGGSGTGADAGGKA
jgi:hypothetical protein